MRRKNMRSSTESGGFKLLLRWQRNSKLIQLHLDRTECDAEFNLNGIISELDSGSLHLLGGGCEAFVDFERDSLKVFSKNALTILLKNGLTILLSEEMRPIPG
jgi:hypothetical protein